MGLFVAIDLPENVLAELLNIQNKLKKLNLFVGNFIESNKLHITLKFLGKNIDLQNLERVIESLKPINSEKFYITLDSIGLFSKDNYPKVLWINVKDENNQLNELQKKIETSLDWLELKLEEKEFKNHLTLARIKSLVDSDKFLEQIFKIKIPKLKFKITEFKLKESKKINNNMQYINLKTFNLY